MGWTVAGWVLEERLGRGAFGEVWKAHRQSVGLARALKLTPLADERALESWRHELDRLDALAHPNIVRFYDADIVTDNGPYQDYAWIATELCDRSLADELRDRPNRTLSLNQCEHLLTEMLAALAAAHDAEIVHRDIKPGNILRHTDGTWKLCDFGTSRLLPSDQSRPYTTVIGTLPYMSPAAHRGRQDYAADLYALGVAVHEALTGRRLHHQPEGMTDSEYIKLILDTPPTISTELPDHWRTPLRALTGLDNPSRPPSAQQLHHWFQTTGGTTPPPRTPPPANQAPAEADQPTQSGPSNPDDPTPTDGTTPTAITPAATTPTEAYPTEPDPEPDNTLTPSRPRNRQRIVITTAAVLALLAGSFLWQEFIDDDDGSTATADDDDGSTATADDDGEPIADQYTAVIVGGVHWCGIGTDKMVSCWGDDRDGQASPPDGQFTAITAGDSHSCGLRTDDTITCWGDDAQGQASAPDGQFTAIAAADLHSCALGTDKMVSCWGRDYDGQASPPDGQFTAITAGYRHSCAIGTDDTITCWGRDYDGQASPPGGQFTAITAGNSHSCAIGTDDTITCWGDDDGGISSPPGGHFTAVTAGDSHSCAIGTDGTITCWNDYEDG